MQILIDMQPLQTSFSAKRGVGTYLAGILNNLPEAARRHDLAFLFNASFPDAYFSCLKRFPFIDKQNSHIFLQEIIPGYSEASAESVRLGETFYSGFVDGLEPDLLFSANLQEGFHEPALTTFAASSGRFTQVATLHDMVPIYYKDRYLADADTRSWYRRKLQDASRCHHIVTVSERSKRDIERFLAVPASQVTSIPNGYDEKLFTPVKGEGELAAIQRFLRSEEPFILYVGGSDPHKNLARLVAAYGRLPRQLQSSFRLVLAGEGLSTASEVTKALSSSGCADRVIFPGYVPRELLAPLLRAADLFVFPSAHEGFGLPALEAMACGVATLGAENSAVGEVIANSVATFDALDADAISACMERVLSDPALRGQVASQGTERAADFSWRKTTEALVDVFEREHDLRSARSRRRTLATRLATLEIEDVQAVARAAQAISQSLPEPRKPRVFLDASSTFYYKGNSGIQRVVRALGRHLPTALRGNADVDLVYAAEGTTRFHLIRSMTALDAEMPDPLADEPADLQAGDILLFADLHPGLAIRSEEQLQRLRALGVKVYYIVYDLLPVLMPAKFWPALQQEFFRWLQAISRADGLICISDTVAGECADYLARYGCERPDRLRIASFPLGSDIATASDQPQVALTDGGKTSDQAATGSVNFLMVGTLEPRKGQEQALDAFELLWEAGKDWSLTIVGKQGWNMARMAKRLRDHPENGRRLFWFSATKDDELERLYDEADCVLCASEGEGFGLPIVEAALAGKPVIVRAIPVFREVAGEGAFFFENSPAPQVLAAALERWVELNGQGAAPLPTGIRPTRWIESAETIASLLEQGRWPREVSPGGMLDIRQSIALPNPNVRMDGVFGKETGFRWTGQSCSLAFTTDSGADYVVLDINCHSWKKVVLNVRVDGHDVGQFEVGTKVDAIRVSLGNLVAGSHIVELIVPSAGTPKGDDRILGIAVHDWQLASRPPLQGGRWVDAHDLSLDWQGFSPIEFEGRWTLAERSEISFELNQEQEAALMVHARAAARRSFRFEINGVSVAEQVVGEEAEDISLPRQSLRKGLNRIAVITPGVTPSGSADERSLGLFVMQLKITG